MIPVAVFWVLILHGAHGGEIVVPRAYGSSLTCAEDAAKVDGHCRVVTKETP